MKHIRGKDRLSPSRQVERDADMFKRLAEDLRAGALLRAELSLDV